MKEGQKEQQQDWAKYLQFPPYVPLYRGTLYIQSYPSPTTMEPSSLRVFPTQPQSRGASKC